MNSSPDIAVVGAGIVGAACAYACAQAGLRVLVLERGCVGGGTTAAGMGHLVVMDDSPAQFALTSYGRKLWRQFSAQLPADVEFVACGTLWVAADDEEMVEVRRKKDYYTGHGIKVEILDADALAKAEPQLRRGLAGGLRVLDDAVIYPPRAAALLIERAVALGAECRTGVDVQSLLPEGGVALRDGTRISAGISVNAAGPWSPSLSPGLPVRKRKGHLVITDRYPGFVHHQIVELGYLKSAHAVSADSVAFNIQPRKTGQMLLGSSRQFDAEDTTIDAEILGRMVRRAAEYLPSIAGLGAIRCWAGHRAATPDKLPLIGPSAANPKIWLATGHEGLGITTSLATGQLLADQVMKRSSAISSVSYQPIRLARGVPRHA